MSAHLTSFFTAQLVKTLPRKTISRGLGVLSDVRLPQPVLEQVIRTYCRVYGVNLDEAEIPSEGFRTLDEFFTRRLKACARAIDQNARALVSPSDGRVEGIGHITHDGDLVIKGRTYKIDELLSSADEAAPFWGGTYIIIYLAPGDYHRVHSPIKGRVTSINHVPGTLFPVNRIGTDHIRKVFGRNERVVVFQHSPDAGLIASAMVGAMGVGRIELSFDHVVETNRRHDWGARDYGDHGPWLDKGDELGIFHLGSTVIIFTPKGLNMDYRVRVHEDVRMGQLLSEWSTHG